MQVVPPKPPGIGLSIAQGISRGLTENVLPEYQRRQERQYEINQTQKGLALAQQAAEQAQGDPVKLAFALAQAQSYSPGLAKSIGPLYQSLMTQMQGKAASNLPQPSVPGAQPTAPGGQPGSTGGQNTQTGQTNTQPSQGQGQFQLPNPTGPIPFADQTEGINLGEGDLPRTYSESDYTNVANSFRQQALDPTPVINQMKQSDEAARLRVQDRLLAAKTTSDIQNLRRGQQEAFRGNLTQHLPGISEENLAIAEDIANDPEFRNMKNDQIRAAQVAKKYHLYEKEVDSFKKAAERVNFYSETHDKQQENLQELVKPMIARGQIQQAIKILADAGHGAVEISRITNPLPNEVVKGFEKLPKFRTNQEILEKMEKIPSVGRHGRTFSAINEKEVEKYVGEVNKEKAKKNEEYKKYIVKNFTPGTKDIRNTELPGTSLLQMRNHYLKNGGNWMDFRDLVTDLVRTGEIKDLDSYQRIELKDIGVNPMASFGVGEILMRLVPGYIPVE